MKNVTVRTQIIAAFTFIFVMIFANACVIFYCAQGIEGRTAALKGDAIAGLYQSGLIKDAMTARHRMSAGSTAAEAGRSGPHEIDRIVKLYEQTIRTDDDRTTFAQFKLALADYEAARSQSSVNRARDIEVKFDIAWNRIAAIAAANQKSALATTDEIDGELRALLVVIGGSSLGVYLALFVCGRRLLGLIIVPLKKLTALMDTMREGDFTQRMTIEGRNELGELGEGFNRMADEVMDLVGQIQRSGLRVSTSMTEIAATSKQQQATATEVAATTTQIGATSREIAATSRELVRTMNDVTKVSDHAAGLATNGHAELAHMDETMNSVMNAAGSINAKLAVLNEKAGAINQVVITITKVADQTNLLSLNAAIEAEKAGEYGRGFAVVSSEIRRLADQTAVATYDIEQIVKEIQSAVSASVMGMDKFSEEVRRGRTDVQEIGIKLSHVIAEVQTLAPQFEIVSEGMQAQALGAEQISEALVQLTDATQQTVESLRQSSSAIDDLNQVSGNLHGSVARFRLAA
ncbi:MAG: methyl-accepting chemotaxis protein [Pseudomonas sp.]|uniref:methyl-accepting chemotaxis protein n=1 Tax=Pseudomonas sp. TaxID=306 RepID=UPI00121C9665|nr:methyl-accepting chemotaxis protein [Pseudomonas sp.]RZI76443.1 MAG: methyl-accepting chemotaxis protein [Pseudomonas sp.]